MCIVSVTTLWPIRDAWQLALGVILLPWASEQCTFSLSFSPSSSSQRCRLRRQTTKLSWTLVRDKPITRLRLHLSPHLRISSPSNHLLPFSIHMLVNSNWVLCFLTHALVWVFWCLQIKQSWLYRGNRWVLLLIMTFFFDDLNGFVDTDMKGRRNLTRLKLRKSNTMKRRKETWKNGYACTYFRSVHPLSSLFVVWLWLTLWVIPGVPNLFRATGSSDPPLY